MMRFQSMRRCLETSLPLLVFLSGIFLASCGEKMQDPSVFYADLVKAARERNGHFMYDVLDSARRAAIDTMIGMQMANLDKIPPAERGKWDSLKGQSKRDIYAKVLTSDKGLTNIFDTDYNVVRVDTLVMVTIQHTGQPTNTVYLRPKNGSYEITQLPRPPGSMPDGHPGMNDPQGAPEQRMPQGGSPPPGSPPPGSPPPGSAPQDSAPASGQRNRGK